MFKAYSKKGFGISILFLKDSGSKKTFFIYIDSVK